MAVEIQLTDATFEEQVVKSDVPVLVDFWAPWCGPCKMIAPIVEEIAGEYGEKLKVGKVNTDENQEIARQYGILSIPTILIFKNGEVAEKIIGAQSKKFFTDKIDAILGS